MPHSGEKAFRGSLNCVLGCRKRFQEGASDITLGMNRLPCPSLIFNLFHILNFHIRFNLKSSTLKELYS